MPANGENTRTVASSSHTRRPVSGTNADCSAATGSTVSAANCGELAGMLTLSPETSASTTGPGCCAGWQPANSSMEISNQAPPAERINLSMSDRLVVLVVVLVLVLVLQTAKHLNHDEREGHAHPNGSQRAFLNFRPLPEI